MRCFHLAVLSCALIPASVCLAQDCETLNEAQNQGRYKDTVCDQAMPPVAAGCKTLPNGETWQSGLWKRDRRPAFFIRLLDPSSEVVHIGENYYSTYSSWNSNPRGLQTWWHKPNANPNDPTDHPDYVGGVPSQFTELSDRMKAAYNLGFRRIVLQLPAGVAFGRKEFDPQTHSFTNYAPQNMSINQWYGMPAWKQDWFKRSDSPFQEFRTSHTDATIELYLGAPVEYSMCPDDLVVTIPALSPSDIPGLTPLDPVKVLLSVAPGIDRLRWVTPAFPGQSSASDYDAHSDTHRDRLFWHLQPWIDAGIEGFWMDASSDNSTNPAQFQRRQGQLELSYNPYYNGQGIHFVGETIPCTSTNGGNSIYDKCSVDKAAWAGLEQVWTMPGGATLRPWNFDRTVSEVHMLLQSGNDANGHNTKLWQLARQCRNHGGIISIFYAGDNYGMNGTYAALVQRWYSMGNFYTADFNGDGRVDDQDLTDFLEAYNDTNRQVKVFATGDIDGNGKITTEDADRFLTMYSWHLTNGPTARNPDYWKDFGAPNDL